MKTLLLILSILLSLYSGGKNKTGAVIASDEGSRCVAEEVLNREFCITATQGQAFAGDGGSNSVSFRSSDAGRRIFPQTTPSTFRVLKGGKVIDNTFVPLSGTRIPERYLFSICRLRL